MDSLRKSVAPPMPPLRDSATAKLFSNYVDMSDLTQREIAAKAGYRRANIITMFKTGETKIPIDKIPTFAEILGIDAKRFLRVALEEYMPPIMYVIEDVLATVLSDNEIEIINELRLITNNGDPKMSKASHHKALAALASELMGKIIPPAGQ